ncbi:hypothetical protein D3C81_1963090 [compost metagenome]
MNHSQVPNPRQVISRKPRKPRTCWSRNSALRWPRRKATYRVKGRLPSSMNTTATQCTAGWGQCASEESEVEKPPVEIAAMAWLIASNGVIPAHQKARKPSRVKAT